MYSQFITVIIIISLIKENEATYILILLVLVSFERVFFNQRTSIN